MNVSERGTMHMSMLCSQMVCLGQLSSTQKDLGNSHWMMRVVGRLQEPSKVKVWVELLPARQRE